MKSLGNSLSLMLFQCRDKPTMDVSTVAVVSLHVPDGPSNKAGLKTSQRVKKIVVKSDYSSGHHKAFQEIHFPAKGNGSALS